MKRNGMCPICYIKKLFTRQSRINDISNGEIYENGVAQTPAMGWSSWNTFRNRINQDMLIEMAETMKTKGLIDAGYRYLNIDDNWHSNLRDENGNLQGDLTTFSMGMYELIKKLNGIGVKVGLYTSNGTLTCEDLPASLGREKQDAYQVAKWGAEYFKYDYCHNIPYSKYAPLVYGVGLSKKGTGKEAFYNCGLSKLSGSAKFMNSGKIENNLYISGLDANGGAAFFDNLIVDESGEYILTVHIKKKGLYSKFLLARFDEKEDYFIEFPEQHFFNYTGRFQVPVKLEKGTHTLRLFNPISSRADSAMFQYRLMGKALKEAAIRVAEENGTEVKPIVYSICEWGKNKPWQWGATAGNSWRTTLDIRPLWIWIMQIYKRTVKLYKYSSKGHYNDPDMLEVGNGKLTYNENISHFSVWCMLTAPLILGNDLRKMPDNVLKIITNKYMIGINQDALAQQAKRIKKGAIDILAKPLTDGKTAILFLNKTRIPLKSRLELNSLCSDPYINFEKGSMYKLFNVWEEQESVCTGTLKTDKIKGHACKVYIVQKA